MLSHDLLCGWAQNPWKENVRFPYLCYEDWSNEPPGLRIQGVGTAFLQLTAK